MRTVFCTVLLILFYGFTVRAQYENDGKKHFDPETNALAQRITPVNGVRKLRYVPDGDDFVITNGKNKFNRALYGTNTGFRVETGDVPEFALYLPNMGGNLHFFLADKKNRKPLNDAATIVSRYRAGSRIYEITDPMLGKGKIILTALAMSDREGLILQLQSFNTPSDIVLSWVFGGAANKRFSREGDLGVDPVDAFELKDEYCVGNEYTLHKNTFDLVFGPKKDKKLAGVFPPKSRLSVSWGEFPVLNGTLKLSKKADYYFAIVVPDGQSMANPAYLFQRSETDREKLASRIKIDTPDPYINTLGGVLATAADGIWDGQVWLHGAVGWRMPLSGWRAAYTGDVLGWHDRARIHFDNYAASQVTSVPPVIPHPAQDSALNFARSAKKWGTQMYSNGYICRNPRRNDQMHHYDMNLCYIDELLWHFNWTGDLDYVRKMWPVLTSHLAWEKRNFDPDNDGLYDAYACIWASDALYYNSGAVTHSSAYNYRANKLAGELADKLGLDGSAYKNEATKILNALNSRLWLPAKGHWAEFQDAMGGKRLHESAAVWTIYHAIDSKIHDPLQGYQAMRYVDSEIPHIPVVADGLKDEGYATIATSNWMPYSWSINNVAFAEVGHTALAYWEAGLPDKAFLLFKSSILDGMYLGASPGNIGQISFYDAARGECYRDFGDPVGVTSRAVVQGLFGISPDLLNARVTIRPGFPVAWQHASIHTPDIDFKFTRADNTDTYLIDTSFPVQHKVILILPAIAEHILSVKQNSKELKWTPVTDAVGYPQIQLECEPHSRIDIEWSGRKPETTYPAQQLKNGQTLTFATAAHLLDLYDPQHLLRDKVVNPSSFTATVSGAEGARTLFVKLQQDDMQWWQPLTVNIEKEQKLQPSFASVETSRCEPVKLDLLFNDSLTNIFKPRYVSPRSPYTTLQIPLQGIGEWCHPMNTAEIDDSGLRRLAANGPVRTVAGIPFITPAAGKNIVFTTLWDNFPQAVRVDIAGKASNAYLLLAGSTSHMQCHIENGIVVAHYTDNTADTLRLVNPLNWSPIEQDFYVDGKAFVLPAERTWRMQLKTGLVSNDLGKDLGITGVYGRKIDGGAAVILDMPLNKNKNLRTLELKTTANEILIGLMGLTLQR